MSKFVNISMKEQNFRNMLFDAMMSPESADYMSKKKKKNGETISKTIVLKTSDVNVMITHLTKIGFIIIKFTSCKYYLTSSESMATPY